jgi:hypothetical protein
MIANETFAVESSLSDESLIIDFVIIVGEKG